MRASELGPLTQESVEQAIQQALSYGFSVEAVAEAAGLETTDVHRVQQARALGL